MKMDVGSERKFPLKVRMIRPFRKYEVGEDLVISSIHLLRPLFLCALLFTALVWISVIYTFLTSTSDFVMPFWLESQPGLPSIMQSLKWVSSAFVIASFLELILNPKHTGCRASFFFCALLAVYCFTLGRNFVQYARILELYRMLAR